MKRLVHILSSVASGVAAAFIVLSALVSAGTAKADITTAATNCYYVPRIGLPRCEASLCPDQPGASYKGCSYLTYQTCFCFYW